MEFYGWGLGEDATAMASIFGALGKQPIARHVAEREDDRHKLALRIWYVLDAGLLDVTTTTDHRGLAAKLTPWTEVSGVTVRSGAHGSGDPYLSLTVTTPDLKVERQEEKVYGGPVTNESWSFIQAVLTKISQSE